MDDRLRATLRSASRELRLEYESKLAKAGVPSEAISGRAVEIRLALTAFFSRSLSSVKFCVTRMVPA